MTDADRITKLEKQVKQLKKILPEMSRIILRLGKQVDEAIKEDNDSDSDSDSDWWKQDRQ